MKGNVTSYTTGDGKQRWRIRYDVTPGPNGERRQRSVSGFARRRDADKALRDALGKVEQGTHPERVTDTLATYLRAWLAGLSRKPTTLDGYRRAAEAKVIPRLGGVRLQALTPEHLDGLYRALEVRGKRAGECQAAGVTCKQHGCSPDRHGPLAPKSVRHVHGMLHAALEDAVRRGHIVRNVAALANPPTQKQARSRSARDRVWTGEQLRLFVESVREERLHAAWRLLAATGMRRAELLGLAWHHLDLDGGTVRVGEQSLTTISGRAEWVDGSEGGKSDAAARTISLDGETVAALRAWRKQQARERLAAGPDWTDDAEHGPLVFTQPDGRAVHPERFLDWTKQRAKRAGLPPPTVHTLRHSYATASLRAGVRVDVLSKRLGHSDPAITLSIYAHVLDGDDAAAAATAAAAIFG